MTKKLKAAPGKSPSKKKPRAAAKRPARKIAKTVQRLDWQGIVVSVSYEADWLGLANEFAGIANAHLEIEAVAPERAVLPVTDTGYRSHFLARGVVEQAGGPVAYAKAWLDQATKSPAWKRRQENARQLCLF